MKRKLFTALLSILFIFALSLGLSACTESGNSNSINGTYYLYENDEYDKSQYIKINNGNWSDDDNVEGTYKISGGKITFYAKIFGSNEEMYSGTYSNGQLKLEALGAEMLYCKEGYSPKEDSTQSIVYTLNADGKSYYVSGTENLKSNEVVIVSTYNGKPVTSIGYGAFANCSSLTSITIPNSVTSIMNDAFGGCSSLASITVDTNNINYKSESNCLLTKDGKTLILGCKNSVIPDGVTSIGDWAFNGCSSLTSITIPNSVTCIGSYAFINCSSLESINISNNVASIGDGAFSGCAKLKEITIPDNVTFIGGTTFSYCSSLTSVTIPNSVTYIWSGAFHACSKLTSINIPDSVTFIGGMAFFECSSLTSINIPDSVTSIGGMAFSSCSSLASITIPDSVISIGPQAFYGCDKIIETENGVQYVDKWVINCDTKVTAINLRKNTKGIAESAFSSCSSLAGITIPDSVTSIGSWTFQGCSSLTSITIPNNVTSIGYMAFNNCSSLTSVTIPDSVTSIGYMAFDGCSKLTSINFKGSVAQWQKISKGISWNDGTGEYFIHCTDGDIDKNGNVTLK